MRREQAKKEMREAKEHEHALKQADTEAKRKLQEIELDTEQARKEARLLEHKAREKEDAQKKEAREKEQKAERFQKIIAARVLGHLRAKVAARGASAKTALETACAMPAVRKRGSRTALAFHLPDFLCHEGGQGVPGTGVQARVFRRVATHQDVSGAKMPIFASESFEWTLCNGMRLYACGDGASAALTRALHQVCPRYSDVCGVRWPALELLREQQACLDLAFLAGVWRYSRALGSSFPDGLPDCWPPPDTYGI